MGYRRTLWGELCHYGMQPGVANYADSLLQNDALCAHHLSKRNTLAPRWL